MATIDTNGNPALIGRRDEQGLPYVWLAGHDQEICYDCALTEFAAGRFVDCIAVITGSDSGEISRCDFCGQPIDPALRPKPDTSRYTVYISDGTPECTFAVSAQDTLEEAEEAREQKQEDCHIHTDDNFGAYVRHADDCECADCRAALDAVMWGWLTPAHLAIAERERRTGDIPIA